MNSLDLSKAAARADLASVSNVSDGLVWKCVTRVDKYAGDPSFEERTSGLVTPFETLEIPGNLLVIGGASIQWQTLIGNGTATAGQALTYFNNGNAFIGVGDSATAAADTQTDLQAATNKMRKAMDATYPLHTDTTGTAGSKSIVFRSTFATTDANWAWQEWGLFNASTSGRMLNRKQESLGTKTSAATWVLTITLSLA